jgi:hypothetical protein
MTDGFHPLLLCEPPPKMRTSASMPAPAKCESPPVPPPYRRAAKSQRQSPLRPTSTHSSCTHACIPSSLNALHTPFNRVQRLFLFLCPSLKLRPIPLCTDHARPCHCKYCGVSPGQVSLPQS